MTDSRCLILGADSDIGRAIADRFALQGFDLYLTTRSMERIDRSWSKTLEDESQIKIDWFYLEGLDFDIHSTFYQNLPAPPNVVICVMGYLGNHEQAKVDFKEAIKIIHSNFTMQVSLLNIVAHDMELRKKGVIIGITSVAGEKGRKSNYYYGSAKAAFTAYLSGLRSRLFNSGVHVMTVKPGYVRTKMTQDLKLPKLLIADPDRLAKRVYRGYVSGSNIIYYLPIWKWIMLFIKYIPESIFKRLNL